MSRAIARYIPTHDDTSPLFPDEVARRDDIAAGASLSIVAYSSPNGLIASTGNLYWTSKIYDEFGPDISAVWRAGKNNVPGNEVVLYREYGDDRYFGDVVYANPGPFMATSSPTIKQPAG